MIDNRIKLDVLHEISGAFTDYSKEAVDYLRDTISVVIGTTDHYLYVGYYKPIDAVYAEVATGNTSGSTITMEAWDGAAWATIEHQDESNAFARSGFITWDRTDMTETTVNSDTQYWVRMKMDIGTSALVINGINLVFSDDQMMKREFPDILDPSLIAAGQNSHILQHVAARNYIVQMLRNDGYIKYNSDTGRENITQWDLLDIYEIREAATYLALSKVFFILSEDAEDNWSRKSQEYERLYNKTFATAKLSLDTNDDGVEDAGEKLVQRKALTWDR